MVIKMKRIMNNKKGLTITFLFIIIILSTIIINKYNIFYDGRTEKEIKENVVIVEDGKINKKNEGKLVLVTGNLNYNNEILHDDIFSIHITTPKLFRYVETYQCYEHTEVDKNGNTVYKQDYIWASGIINSKCKNPKKKLIDNKFYYANTIRINEFNLDKTQKEKLPCNLRTNIRADISLPDGYKVYDNFITNSENPDNPKIGDIRLTFFYNTWNNISILAKQKGNTFTEYNTKNNEDINVIHFGKYDIESMIDYINTNIIKK